jgi:hypothetical protein
MEWSPRNDVTLLLKYFGTYNKSREKNSLALQDSDALRQIGFSHRWSGYQSQMILVIYLFLEMAANIIIYFFKIHIPIHVLCKLKY